MKSTQNYSTYPSGVMIGVLCRSSRIIYDPFLRIYDIHFGRFQPGCIGVGYEGYMYSTSLGRNTPGRTVNLSLCANLLRECAFCLSNTQEKVTHCT